MSRIYKVCVCVLFGMIDTRESKDNVVLCVVREARQRKEREGKKSAGCFGRRVRDERWKIGNYILDQHLERRSSIMLDIPSLKVTELKAELDKAGVTYSKSSKKAELAALLQSHQESTVDGEPTPSVGVELELDVNGKVAPVSTLSIPPPAEVISHSESLSEAAAEQPVNEQSDIPVAPNPDEIPVPLTKEQEAVVEEAETLGAGSNGAEGALSAGIALKEIGSETETETEENGKEKEKEKADIEIEAEAKKRSFVTEEEEETDKGMNKRARPNSPDVPIAAASAGAARVIQPQENDPSAERPSNFIEGGHPPTRSLYITNLRRPLPDEVLRNLLDPFGPIDHQAGYGGSDEGQGGWWLSPVKSHAFVSYLDTTSARRAYEGLQSLEGFPPEAIDPPALKVEYLSTGAIPSLVDQEEASWRGGRKKLNLTIRKESSADRPEEDHWVFEYKSAGDVSLMGNRRPMGGIPTAGFRPSGGGTGGSSAFRPPPPAVGRPVGQGLFDNRRANAPNRPPTGPRIPPIGPARGANSLRSSSDAHVPTGPSGPDVGSTFGRSTNGYGSRPGWTAADRRREENFRSSRRDQRDRDKDWDSRDSRDYRAPRRDGPWPERDRDGGRNRDRDRDRDRRNYGRSRGDSYRPVDDRR